MADTVTLDPGTGGAVIATDDLGATGHVQLVKLVDGTDNGTGRIAGDASNGLDVDVTRSALPTGASTAAKQPALGTAGAASADVVTVQGVASMTPLLVNGSGVTQPVSGTVTASGPVTDAQLRASAVPVSLATLPALVAGTAAIGKLAANSGVDIGDVDVTSLPGALAGIADDAPFTVATTPVLPIGFLADQASTDSVNEGDIGAARMTLDRKQIVTISPSSDTEGLDVGPGTGAKQISAASTNGTSVKASAGKVFGWYLYNDGATEAYLKIYNKASAPTVGTDVPVLVIPIPAGAAANVEFTQGIAFATGIATALTTGFADADTGAVAAGQVITNLFYK